MPSTSIVAQHLIPSSSSSSSSLYSTYYTTDNDKKFLAFKHLQTNKRIGNVAVGSDVSRGQSKRFFAVERQHLWEWNIVILMANFHFTAATETQTLKILFHPFLSDLPSVLWQCRFGVTKRIHTVKNWLMKCWRGYLSGARCKWFACGPADATPSLPPHFLISSKVRLA